MNSRHEEAAPSGLDLTMTALTDAGLIRIEFARPVRWIGLTVTDAMRFRDQLDAQIVAVAGGRKARAS